MMIIIIKPWKGHLLELLRVSISRSFVYKWWWSVLQNFGFHFLFVILISYHMKPSKPLRSSLNIKFIIGKLWNDATIEKWRPLDVGHMFPQVFNALVTMGATFKWGNTCAEFRSEFHFVPITKQRFSTNPTNVISITETIFFREEISPLLKTVWKSFFFLLKYQIAIWIFSYSNYLNFLSHRSPNCVTPNLGLVSFNGSKLFLVSIYKQLDHLLRHSILCLSFRAS